MSNVITFASSKGGSGKTTLTATIGSLLTELGYSVLLVDCDEATNGLTLLFIDKINDYPAVSGTPREDCFGVFDPYDHVGHYSDAVEVSENLYVCPASFTFDKKPQFSTENFSQQLKCIVEYHNKFDFILLDAQAGADDISLVAISKAVSQAVIIVSEYDPLSAAGVERLKAIAGDSLGFDRTWILLNKMLPEFVEKFSEFLSVSHYLPPIPWTADVVRAYAKRELALNFVGGNDYTLAILQTAKSFPVTGIREKIEKWSELKAASLRQPILSQYDDYERLLNAAIHRSRQIKDVQRRTALLAFLLPTMLTAAGAFYYIWLPERDSKLNTETILEWVSIFTAIIIFSLGSVIFYTAGGNGLSLINKILSYVGISLGGLDHELELSRLERQVGLYTEKLRELEFLKAADIDALISDQFIRR